MTILYLMITLLSGQVAILETDTETYLECRTLGDRMITRMHDERRYRHITYKCVVSPEAAA